MYPDMSNFQGSGKFHAFSFFSPFLGFILSYLDSEPAVTARSDFNYFSEM